jgi:hypothetical protein
MFVFFSRNISLIVGDALRHKGHKKGGRFWESMKFGRDWSFEVEDLYAFMFYYFYLIKIVVYLNN